ncbi:DNA internalization-related competence protein ComEC/Rec2 [uncultured Salinisphaera sp.]|uniref:DNA internalization-related competence protein ComEC/Rec2 n=1 Tax=uncultured Salinisphaera sp. TaxID=359372 RepID=UPI0032B3071C
MGQAKGAGAYDHARAGAHVVRRALQAADRDPRWLAVSLIAVVAATYLQPAPLPLWLFGALLLPCFWRWPGRIVLFVALAGAAWTSFGIQRQLDSRWPVARTGETVPMTGHVVGIVAHDPYRARFVLARDTPPYRLRLSWYDHGHDLLPGDCLSGAFKLDTPHGSANPGTFDYEGWLWRERIDASGYIRQAKRCDTPPRLTVDRLRALAMRRIEPFLEGSAMKGIVAALTLGIRDAISDEQWAVLRATGTSHLVAISGLHIGLVAGWLFALARWLALRFAPRSPVPWLAGGVGLAGALFYALLAGFALPTQRALVMVAAGLFALVAMRHIAVSRILALAAIVVVLWAPVSVISPGFWLSFGAVAWLIYLGRVVTRRRVLGFIMLQLGLVAGLGPLSAWFFGQASLVAPLVNALLIPAAVVLVPVLLLATVVALLVPGVGGPALAAIATALEWAWPGLAALASWPWASIHPGVHGAMALVLALVGVALLAMPRGLPGRWLAPVFLLPAVIGMRPAAHEIAPGGLRLAVLDVGQGLAVVVRTRRHTLVYDAGPAYRTGFNAGDAFVVPYLRHVGRTTVDELLISHSDNDHMGGAQAISEQIEVRRRSGADSGHPCRAGQHWQWDGVDFTVLYPSDDDIEPGMSNNARSCVLRIDAPGGRVLLPGDIEQAGEQVLVERDAAVLAANVLVVAHHGSASSSSQPFVTAVAPDIALVSAGWHNRWGFPDEHVVARLRAAGAGVVNTADSGAIELAIRPTPGPPEVSRWRQAAPRVWHTP